MAGFYVNKTHYVLSIVGWRSFQMENTIFISDFTRNLMLLWNNIYSLNLQSNCHL